MATGNQSRSRCFWCSQECSFGLHTLNLRAFECGIPRTRGWWHYQCHRIPSWPLAGGHGVDSKASSIVLEGLGVKHHLKIEG